MVPPVGITGADASDATQIVMVRLARAMGTFRYDPRGSFRAWLRTLARHAWSDLKKAQQRAVPESGDSRTIEKLHRVEAREDLVCATLGLGFKWIQNRQDLRDLRR